MRVLRITAFALLAQSCLTGPVFALDPSTLPTGGSVVSGNAVISQSGTKLNVNQSSDRAIVNWKSFDIGAGAKVHFQQPSSSSAALNRVQAGNASQIHGQLTSNGQIYLVNPSGVLFGKTAQVNVGGLVASTHNITDNNFRAGRDVFTRDGATGTITNQGSITADGGKIALIAPSVANTGSLKTQGGNVALAAGDKVTIAAGAGGFLQVEVDGATLNTLVQNSGVIQADGGQIVLNAEAASKTLSSVVSNSGTVQAQTLQNKAGKILLLADMQGGQTHVGGTLDASAPNGGNGGFIETSAASVKVADGARVTTKAASGQTGNWLLDPDDFTIAASGGDMTGAAVSAAVQANNFEVQTNAAGVTGSGDIFVRDAISWTADTTLTLTADRNIDIRANITATGDNAGLVLGYGRTTASSDYSISKGKSITLSGATPTLQIGEVGSLTTYTVINDVVALQSVNLDPNGNYALGSNIDASATVGWNAGEGFIPLGEATLDLGTGAIGDGFFGKFHGLGHAVSDMYINRPAGFFAGMISLVNPGSVLRDVGMIGGDITGFVVTGSVAGGNLGVISNAYSSATVNGSNANTGGLVGVNGFGGVILDSYATGDVNGNIFTGGLVGMQNTNATIKRSFATGNVSGTDLVGGLVGTHGNTLGGIGTGNVIEDSYATGNVIGNDYVGGLVGFSDTSSITNSYSTGTVAGNSSLGGLLGGDVTSTITNSYWNSQTSGMATSAAGTALTTAQMKQAASFVGWDLDDAGGSGSVWRLYEGHSNPLLRSSLIELTVTGVDDAIQTNDAPYSGGNGVTYDPSGYDGSKVFGTLAYGGTSQGASAVGAYDIMPEGLYSGELGYDIITVAGELTITASPPPSSSSGGGTTPPVVTPPVDPVTPPVAPPVPPKPVVSAPSTVNSGTLSLATIVNTVNLSVAPPSVPSSGHGGSHLSMGGDVGSGAGLSSGSAQSGGSQSSGSSGSDASGGDDSANGDGDGYKRRDEDE